MLNTFPVFQFEILPLKFELWNVPIIDVTSDVSHPLRFCSKLTGWRFLWAKRLFILFTWDVSHAPISSHSFSVTFKSPFTYFEHQIFTIVTMCCWSPRTPLSCVERTTRVRTGRWSDASLFFFFYSLWKLDFLSLSLCVCAYVSVCWRSCVPFDKILIFF